MKYLLLILILSINAAALENNDKVRYFIKNGGGKIISALRIVESNGNSKAIGDNGKAYGVLQIWECVIKDVNRIYKTNYKHEDAFDNRKSFFICAAYLAHYGRGKNRDQIIRIWNGGPSGHKKESTINYLKKVNKLLRRKELCIL